MGVACRKRVELQGTWVWLDGTAQLRVGTHGTVPRGFHSPLTGPRPLVWLSVLCHVSWVAGMDVLVMVSLVVRDL